MDTEGEISDEELMKIMKKNPDLVVDIVADTSEYTVNQLETIGIKELDIYSKNTYILCKVILYMYDKYVNKTAAAEFNKELH